VTEKHVGSVAVDSSQIVITDPINPGSDERCQRVAHLTLEKGAGGTTARIVCQDGERTLGEGSRRPICEPWVGRRAEPRGVRDG
jgi:hypothetical protein